MTTSNPAVRESPSCLASGTTPVAMPTSADLDVMAYARLFQVCDSTFPIGSFNHSFGMENYLSDGRIKKAPQFEEWFEAYFRSQYAYGEGFLVRLTYEALDAGDVRRVWDLDRIIYCSTPARETREGTRLIARQMVSLIRLLHAGVPLLDEYADRMAAGESFGSLLWLFWATLTSAVTTSLAVSTGVAVWLVSDMVGIFLSVFGDSNLGLSVCFPRPVRHKTGEGRSPSLSMVAGSAEGGLERLGARRKPQENWL